MHIGAAIPVQAGASSTHRITESRSMTEEDLIDGCKKGKRKAQSQLYNQYCGAMLAIAMRYCDNRTEAEDALQDAFVNIFKRIKDFEGRREGSLTAWIKTIVINAALSLNRKNKKHNFTDDVTELRIADPDELFASSLDDDDSEEKRKSRILKAVQELPTGYRAVFNLYVMEGYSHKEIAEILEVSENTSKSQLSKARKYLKTYLGIKD